MIRAVCFTIVGILIITIFTPINITAEDNINVINLTSGQYDKGYRYNIQGWVYIHIEGEPYERGFQYGYLASAEISDLLQRWINHEFNRVEILNRFKFKNPEKLWSIFRTKAKNNFLKYVPNEYLEELEGLTDGLKSKEVKIFNRIVEFDDILTYQFIQDIEYSSFRYPFRRFHPIRRFLFTIKQIITKNTDDYLSGHCTAFIATGDATKNGEIVVAHSTIFSEYIAERCNIILDVQPTQGNRFLMACPPGSIWSQEDWYQNEKGIILTETELTPQGPWKKRGIPKGVRSRSAIQYSDSIDDVLNILIEENNGLIPNEWLIGDTKTGEIASIELALFNKPIKRTFNGFYWSCNLAHDKRVSRELSVFPKIINLILKLNPNILPGDRAEKFFELEEQYYGQIDTNNAKKIMSTHPIYVDTTDCKITSSKQMKHMGLFAFIGRPDGEQWNPTEEEKNMNIGVTELPACGWLEIFPSKSSPNKLLTTELLNSEKKCKVLWEYKTENANNMDYSISSVSEDNVITAMSTGNILTLNTNYGTLNWKDKINELIVDSVTFKDLLFVGGENGLYAFEKETGKIKWKQTVGFISCKPVVAKNLVIAGCENGDIYAFDINSGKISWSKNFLESATISEASKDIIYVGSGDSCYALNLKDRSVIWDFKTSGKISASPKAKDNNVYVGSWDGNLYALDNRDGNLKWTYNTGWGIVTTPAVSDNLIFVASNDNNFYALNRKNGNLEWDFKCKSAIHSNPVVYGDYVFFGSDDGRFYALKKTDGDLAWSFTPGYYIKDDALNYLTTPILSDPHIEDGVVYISAKGTIYALDAQTFEKTEKNSIKHTFDLISIIIIFVLLFIALLLIALKIKIKQKRK
jgi:outer membrane protein assembly factor BamB